MKRDVPPPKRGAVDAENGVRCVLDRMQKKKIKKILTICTLSHPTLKIHCRKTAKNLSTGWSQCSLGVFLSKKTRKDFSFAEGAATQIREREERKYT